MTKQKKTSIILLCLTILILSACQKQEFYQVKSSKIYLFSNGTIRGCYLKDPQPFYLPNKQLVHCQATITFHENGLIESANFPVARKMKIFDKGELKINSLTYHKNGKIKEVYLAEEGLIPIFNLPQLLPANCHLFFYIDGKIEKIERDGIIQLKDKNQKTLSFRNQVSFNSKGEINSPAIILDKKQKIITLFDKQKINIIDSTYYPNGKIESLRLANPQNISWQDNAYLLEKEIRFHENGNIQLFHLAKETPIPINSDNLILAIGKCSFYKDGKPLFLTLSRPHHFKINNSILAIAAYASFNQDGSIKNTFIAQKTDFTLPSLGKLAIQHGISFHKNNAIHSISYIESLTIHFQGKELPIRSLKLYKDGEIQFFNSRKELTIKIPNGIPGRLF